MNVQRMIGETMYRPDLKDALDEGYTEGLR